MNRVKANWCLGIATACVLALLGSPKAALATQQHESAQSTAPKTPDPAAKGAQTLALVVVTGTRESLARAEDIKREAIGVVDAVSAESVGKFPNTNIAEALQRIPGVTIDRNGGEGQ